MATLYSRLYTEFNTNWDGNVITKPTLIDGRFQMYAKGNYVRFDTAALNTQAGVAFSTAGRPYLDRTWTFGIECSAVSDANLELILEQACVRLLAYSGTNIRWNIESVGAFENRHGQRVCYINCSETAVVAPASW